MQFTLCKAILGGSIKQAQKDVKARTVRKIFKTNLLLQPDTI